MNVSIPSFLLSICLLVWGLGHAYGQETPTKVGVKVPYYLDITSSNKGIVHTIHDALLNIQYTDAYGQKNECVLKIYNWKREEVAVYSLYKEFGLNSFNIDLGSVFVSWKEGEIYACEMTDESGHLYELLLRKQLITTVAPTVDILVNPIRMECKALTGNLVEFYGQISGGKTPYQVNWYVLNQAQSDFLYQPREEIIAEPGKTMVIYVNKNPDYYVLVHVKDACGNEQKQMVHVLCSDKKKKINTLFVEPLRELPTPTMYAH